jgi:hypothetical protein
MDRQALIQALQALDNQLASSLDVVIVGGAAMILHFGASRATLDVDVLVLRGEAADLRQAANIVALREQDLEDLELLLPQLSTFDRQVILQTMDHVSHFRPDWAQRMQYFLEEQGWDLR